MKKVSIILFLLLVVLISRSFSQTVESQSSTSEVKAIALDPEGYMNAKWGMSVDEVKTALKGKFLINMKVGKARMFYYTEKFGLSKCMVFFVFNNEEKLYSVQITPMESMGTATASVMTSSYMHPEGMDLMGSFAVTTFKILEPQLITKYGSPVNVVRENRSGIVDEDEAARRGQALWVDNWDFPKTTIVLQVKREPNGTMGIGGRGQFAPLLTYQSKEIAAPVFEQKKKASI